MFLDTSCDVVDTSCFPHQPLCFEHAYSWVELGSMLCALLIIIYSFQFVNSLSLHMSSFMLL